MHNSLVGSESDHINGKNLINVGAKPAEEHRQAFRMV